jgi:hypothetical protein
MIWALVAFSAIYGWAAAFTVRRFSDTTRVRATINRIGAHLMELELFLDSPSVILRAQRSLIRENLRLLRLILPASLIPSAVFVLLYPQLDAMFGHSPLRIGVPTVVTARADYARLEAPAGFTIETPGVRNVHERELDWRLRPIGQAAGQLRVSSSDTMISRRIVAGSGIVEDWRLPFTAPAIAIRYPRREYPGVGWLVWFFVVSLVGGAIGWRR